MKKLLFLFASLVLVNTNATAKTNTIEAPASVINNVRGYGNSFIFNEAGIEFSVFADGQFDFFIPSYGPDVSIGINSPSFALSFNSGFNYNPYVQYDSFGAIIQIENTPVFYDYYGRVNQVGNIFINYNGFGRINRIGGLSIHYRNNVFWRYDGFINVYNRAYIWRPWHRFYAVPHVNYCLVNVNPYRQFYAPVRHTFYRPYRNNVRHFNVNNSRRGNTQIGRHNAITRTGNRYAQAPRNERERNVSRTVERNNRTIIKNRTARLNEANVSRSSRTNRVVESNAMRSNPRANRVAPRKSNTKNVTRTQSSVSNKKENERIASVRKPNTTKSRTYNASKPQSIQKRSTIQNKRKSSSVTSRSNTSRKNNQSSTRSNSRRSKG